MTPIFIGGTGRSGTTILKQVLATHPNNAAIPRELRVIIDPDGLLDLKQALTQRWSPYHADAAVRRFRRLMYRAAGTSLLRRADAKYLPKIAGITPRRYITQGFEKFFGKEYYRARVDQFIDQIVFHISNGYWDGTPTFIRNAQIYEADPQPAEDVSRFIRELFNDLFSRICRPMVTPRNDSKSAGPVISGRRIAICSTAYPYDYSRILHRQARTLAMHFNVTIIACAPFPDRQLGENLRVIGLPLWKSKLQRIANLFRLWKEIRRHPADLYIFEDVISILLIPFVKWSSGAKVVYDIHENFHGLLKEKDWIPPMLRGVAAGGYVFAERLILRFCDMLWLAVSDIAEDYRSVTHIPQVVIGNFPDLHHLGKFRVLQESRVNRFVFVGSMNADRSVLQMLRAFSIFAGQKPDWELLLVGPFYSGDYQQKISAALQGFQLGNRVQMPGALPYEPSMKLIGEAKVGLSLHQPTYNFLRGLPLKLLEYLALGTPVIASNFANFKNIVGPHGCGLCVDPGRPEEIARAMIYLSEEEAARRQMAEKGLALVAEKYNWASAGEVMTGQVEKLLKGGG